MKDMKIEVLLHEHSLINKKIDDFINNQLKYITTLISMSAGFIYVAIQSDPESNFNNAIVFLPYLIIIIGAVFLFKFNRAVILHGYRHYLENKVNFFLETKLIFGGALVKAKLLQTNIFAIFNSLVMLILFLFTIYMCSHSRVVIESKKLLVFVFNPHFFIQTGIIVVGTVVFFIKNNKAFDDGFNFAEVKYLSE
jgi:hypothetical protein